MIPIALSEPMALLLPLMALLGLGVGYWWGRRQLVAVMQDQRRLQAEWAECRAQWAAAQPAAPVQPDFTPLTQRISAIEKAVGAIRLPTPEAVNLRPVLDAVASLRAPEALGQGLEPLQARIASMEDALRRHLSPGPSTAEFAVLLARMDRMEQALRASAAAPSSTPSVSLQPLMASLLELQRGVAALRAGTVASRPGEFDRAN